LHSRGIVMQELGKSEAFQNVPSGHMEFRPCVSFGYISSDQRFSWDIQSGGISGAVGDLFN
ncbi:MAG: hypothetical protein ACLFUS_11435, partial [Candidatus Sumerlaeia bacterium]